MNQKTSKSLQHAGVEAKFKDPSLQTIQTPGTSKIVFDKFRVNVPKKAGPYIGMHNLKSNTYQTSPQSSPLHSGKHSTSTKHDFN